MKKTVGNFCKELGISRDTYYRYIKSGLLKAGQKNPLTGRMKMDEESLKALLEKARASNRATVTARNKKKLRGRRSVGCKAMPTEIEKLLQSANQIYKEKKNSGHYVTTLEYGSFPISVPSRGAKGTVNIRKGKVSTIEILHDDGVMESIKGD